MLVMRSRHLDRPLWWPLAWAFGVLAAALPSPPAAGEEDLLVTRGEVGKRGGRLVAALAAEPRTFNPAVAGENASIAVIETTMADLIHIDRESQETVPALARSWTASADGRRYTLELRRGLRFSDGHPFDADDVVFSFEVYLDEAVASPQRDLLLIGARPIAVAKLDDHTVEVVLAEPYAAAERLFDGFAILPRHRLGEAHRRGELATAWSLGTPPDQIVGLGPFRLREHRPGEHLVLERNPFYWKVDSAGARLPYLEQLVFRFVPTQDAKVLRFQAGEIDVVERLSADSYAQLAEEAGRRGWEVRDLGPSLDYNFLFFNLNPVAAELPRVARRQRWFRQRCFRQAVSAAIDRQGIARLVYRGRATALATHVTPGNKRWVHAALEPSVRSLARASRLLEECGFRRAEAGALVDGAGQRVELSILTLASSSERQRIATIVQQDLQQLGIGVQVVALELKAAFERLFQTFDYDACILGLSGGDTDPNPALNVLLSDGSHHLWHLGQSEPATPWEAEIDRLMKQQLTTLDPRTRKRLYDRVQEIVAEELPMIPLVSSNVLVAAKRGLGNFRPAILDHPTLWNAEELFWR